MPLVNNIHIDRALTNISQKITNDELVSQMIWPPVDVKKDSDKYFKYDRSNLRVEDDQWAPKAEANEIDWDVTEDSYKTQRRALADLVEDDEVRNADVPIQPMTDTTENLTEKLMIRQEKRLADILQDVANYDADAQPTLVAATQWDNFASPTSDPNKDIATARVVMRRKIFKSPNLIVLPAEVFEQVREHPKVFERIKFVERAVVTAEILASLWNVERVLVAGGGENISAEGAADDLQFIWGKNVYIGWVTKRAALKSASWGYHIRSQKFRMDRWRDEPREGTVLRNSFKETPKLVTQAAGYIIQAAVA